ncbi:MAG: cyclopropane-fatty-acyl-phospholipid synthase family protein [Gammaproteobacteria bacterium]|nr:cyclopropane-fatty-acyl-phospholipid synthase family protein [Gammaproteobacteria bacterium]
MNYFFRHKKDKYASVGFDQSRLAGAAVRAENIVSSVLADYQGSTAIRLWNDRVLNDAPNTTCALVFRNPGVLRELLLKRDLLKLGEAYLSGNIDIEGELEALFDLIACLQKMQLPLANKLILLAKALRLPKWTNAHQVRQMRASQFSNRNCRASISHHYDVSNNFYKLWLDPQMVYSCAYFRDDRQSLADAQCDKLDYICRKLRLQSGQHLLDIGCGWGALICWAARQYGVQSHGITLSQQQYEYARQRINDEGLQDQVSVELCDYRDLPENIQYDRIVSVGMFEHVGIENFPRYFGTVKSLLKPGGLFLNHGITNDTGWEKTDLTRFINHYVFPDGELARISDVSLAMERSGFELLDVESLRRHYAMTLRYWVQALKLNRNTAVRESSEATCRLWQLYMSGSAYYFDEGSLNVYQILAGHAHQSLTTPLRRDDIYRQ